MIEKVGDGKICIRGDGRDRDNGTNGINRMEDQVCGKCFNLKKGRGKK